MVGKSPHCQINRMRLLQRVADAMSWLAMAKRGVELPFLSYLEVVLRRRCRREEAHAFSSQVAHYFGSKTVFVKLSTVCKFSRKRCFHTKNPLFCIKNDVIEHAGLTALSSTTALIYASLLQWPYFHKTTTPLSSWLERILMSEYFETFVDKEARQSCPHHHKKVPMGQKNCMLRLYDMIGTGSAQMSAWVRDQYSIFWASTMLYSLAHDVCPGPRKFSCLLWTGEGLFNMIELASKSPRLKVGTWEISYS